jgi:putative flippase GtrA
MPPTWLTFLAWASLAAGFLSAGATLFDVYGRGLRQPMRVMEAVWPITALYLGPLGWLAYARVGRPRVERRAGAGREAVAEWQDIAVSASHCGAGCALGDVAGEWVVFAGSITIAGAALWPGYVLDYAIAYVLGILFQYLAIKPMSDLSRRAALRRAIQADTLSIVAFELGMFAWMALVYFVLFTHPHLSADDAAFWLMMQLAMAIGLLTTYPTNAWLVRRGVKHPMGRPTLRAAAAGAATSRERVA